MRTENERPYVLLFRDLCCRQSDRTQFIHTCVIKIDVFTSVVRLKSRLETPPPVEFNLAIECSIPLGGIELMTFGHEVQDFTARPFWLKMIYEHIFLRF